MKSQSHLIEFVLVIGIALAGLSSALMWAKPLWNKSFSKTKYLKFVDSAKEIYKALINIDKIKEKTFNIEYDKLYANETFMEISIKGNFFKGIMGYWFPLVEGIYGVNPINGKLETNQTQYLV